MGAASKEMHPAINAVVMQLNEAADTDRAAKMEAYMKKHFSFFGVPSPERNKIQREAIKTHGLPAVAELPKIIKYLWEQDQRELQYLAQELCHKVVKKKAPVPMIMLYEFMITHKPWWDTIDYIAKNLVGEYAKLHPNVFDRVYVQWLKSDNIWLQRSCLLYQLGYKETTLPAYLDKAILDTKHNKEFFIQKAIGWALREYGKTNPSWVIDAVKRHKLEGLAKREALRIIISKG